MRIKKLLLMPLLAALILCGGLFPAFAQSLDHECVTLRRVAEKAAGCEDGNIRYAVCDVCDTWYSDAFPDGIISNHADVIIPGTGHAPSADWTSDAEGHWHACMNADCTAKLDFAAHTPDADDGNCETPILCTACQAVTTLGKTHVPAADWTSDAEGHWHACTNAGCTAKLDFVAHTPGADDGNCETPILCTACQAVVTAGKMHISSTKWTSDAEGHWHACANAGCMVKWDFAAHTPGADDGNCETPSLCTVCQAVVVAGKPHTPEQDDKDCTTPVLCTACGTVITAAKKHATNEWVIGQVKHWHSCKNERCNRTYDYDWHTPEVDDENCETPILCAVCGKTLTEGKKHAWASDWASDSRYHWHPCENEGCRVLADWSDHTVEEVEDENDNMPLTCSICGATLRGGWNQTGGSGGCYIATSIYGSYDCPEVWTLRRFRDNRLAQTEAGRLFIQAYYAVSPALVEQLGDAQWFKAIGKTALDGLVNELMEQGFESTPYADPTW